MKLKLHNIDRAQSAVFGGEPSPYDFCIVYDLDRTTVNPLTREPRPVQVYQGALSECHAWMREHGKR